MKAKKGEVWLCTYRGQNSMIMLWGNEISQVIDCDSCGGYCSGSSESSRDLKPKRRIKDAE